eukprot:scaffold3.g6466.t1
MDQCPRSQAGALHAAAAVARPAAHRRLAPCASSLAAGKQLTVIHFNDVYNIDARTEEPVGGAARLATAMRSFADERPLVLFSGDCLNPSLMSAFTRGEQMVAVLNALGVQASVVGNHDCDFGTEVLRKHMRLFRFPWLLSNVLDVETHQPLAGAKRWHMLEWQGVKIGLVGLVEREWLVTIPSLAAGDIEFLDFCEEGRRLARLLRDKGADLVVALTHMRAPNDMLLAAEVPELQLILAGHDHHFAIDRSEPHGTWVVKSGTDFREFSVLRFEVPGSPDARPELQWERVEVTSQIPEASDVAAIVEHYEALIGTKMDEPLGWTHVDLDARFDTVRTGESNLGNLLADIMRTSLQADAAFFNGGTIRSDAVHRAGQLTMRDFVSMLPFQDELVLLELTGAEILAALETGVGSWPKLEGRFLQARAGLGGVSGLHFAFDPSRNPGSRVVPGSVVVATKAYLRGGKDGFECLQAAPVLVDGETAPRLATLVQYLLMRVEQLNEQLGAELQRIGGEQQEQQQQQQQGQPAGAGANGAQPHAGATSSSSDGGGGGGSSGRGSLGSSSSSRSSGTVAAAGPAGTAVADGGGVAVQQRQHEQRRQQQGPDRPPDGAPDHSSAALTALSYLEPCTHGLDSMYAFLPNHRRFGICPRLEGRIIRVDDGLPELLAEE